MADKSQFKKGKTLEELKAGGCKQVVPPNPDPNNLKWIIYGHDPGGVWVGNKLVAIYWLNNNTGNLPDPQSGRCMGSTCHWALTSDLHYWTIANVCSDLSIDSFFAY